MRSIRSRFDRRIDDRALVVAEFGWRVVRHDPQLFERIERWLIGQWVVGSLIGVDAVELKVVRLFAVAVDLRTAASRRALTRRPSERTHRYRSRC